MYEAYSRSLDANAFCHEDHTYCGKENQSSFHSSLGDMCYDYNSLDLENCDAIDIYEGDGFGFYDIDTDNEFQIAGLDDLWSLDGDLNDTATGENEENAPDQPENYENNMIYEEKEFSEDFTSLQMLEFFDDSEISLDLIEPTFASLDSTTVGNYANILVKEPEKVSQNFNNPSLLPDLNTSEFFEDCNGFYDTSKFTEEEDFFQTGSSLTRTLSKTCSPEVSAISLLAEYDDLLTPHQSSSKQNLEERDINNNERYKNTDLSLESATSCFHSNNEISTLENDCHQEIELQNKSNAKHNYFHQPTHISATSSESWKNDCSSHIPNFVDTDFSVPDEIFDHRISPEDCNGNFDNEYEASLSVPQSSFYSVGADLQSHQMTQQSRQLLADVPWNSEIGEEPSSFHCSQTSDENCTNLDFLENDVAYSFIESDDWVAPHSELFVPLEADSLCSSADGWEIQTEKHVDGTVCTNYVNEINCKPPRNSASSNVNIVYNSIDQTEYYFRKSDVQFLLHSNISSPNTLSSSVTNDITTQQRIDLQQTRCIDQEKDIVDDATNHRSLPMLDLESRKPEGQENSMLSVCKYSPAMYIGGRIESNHAHQLPHVCHTPRSWHSNNRITPYQSRVAEDNRNYDYPNVINQNFRRNVQCSLIESVKKQDKSAKRDAETHIISSPHQMNHFILLSDEFIKKKNGQLSDTFSSQNYERSVRGTLSSRNQEMIVVLNNDFNQESVMPNNCAQNGLVIKEKLANNAGDEEIQNSKSNPLPLSVNANGSLIKGIYTKKQFLRSERLAAVQSNLKNISSTVVSKGSNCVVSKKLPINNIRTIGSKASTPSNKAQMKGISTCRQSKRPLCSQSGKVKSTLKKDRQASKKSCVSKTKAKSDEKCWKGNPKNHKDSEMSTVKSSSTNLKETHASLLGNKKSNSEQHSQMTVGMESLFVSFKFKDIWHKNVRTVKDCFKEEIKKSEKERQQEWKDSFRLIRENKIKRLNSGRW